MAGLTLHTVFGPIHRLIHAAPSQVTPDQELLARFLSERDERAFASLMDRHAAMVLGVCRRILKNGHDAEDACQAVFLVLARKAASIRKTASLPAWLHGVAWFVAHKLHHRLARRSTHEKSAAAQQATSCEPADITWREVQQLVDEELHLMPKIYQTPLVLCYLEGRTQADAAKELGCSLGAVRGRLERGRDMLRARLTRRGVTGASALAIAILLPSVASAAVPPTLIAATANASVSVAMGGAIPSTIPVQVARLTHEALQTSLLAKLAMTATLCACIVFLGVAVLLGADFSSDANVARGPTEGFEVWREASRLEMPGRRVWSVAFSPDGRRIAAGAAGPMLRSGELRMWDADTGKVLYALETAQPVRCVVFAPDGQTLATAEHDGMARLRAADDGKVLFTLRGHRSQIDTVAFAADGKTLATSGWDGTAKLWDTATGLETRTLAGHDGQVFTVAFGPSPAHGNGGMPASGGVDSTARIWRPETGESRFTLRGHTDVVHWLTFTPDGKTLATASWDKTVKLWDAHTGNLTATLVGHTESVHAVAFSSDGKTLASSAGRRLVENMPGEVILWDTVAHQARARLMHPDRVFGIAFSPDSATVVTAGWDGTVRRWKHDPDRHAPPDDKRTNAAFQFVVAAAQPGDQDAPPPKKDYAANFYSALKGANADVSGLVKYGPDATDCVKFEPDGLRITLPIGYPRPRPGTGVVTDFGVKGDFEITANIEILQEPNAGLPGNPTDLKLVIVPNDSPEPGVWHKSNQNRAVLAREAAGRGNFGGFFASSTEWDPDLPKDKWGNENFSKIELQTNKRIPAKAKAKAGRLRLLRTGPMLYFFASEDADKDFVLLQKKEFSAKDLKNVRVLGSTGSAAALLDVRVTDLHVRADAFIKAAAPSPPLAAVEPAPAAERGSWLFPLALVPVFAIALALGIWMVARMRRNKPAEAKPAERAPSAIAFECPHCGKRLKAKSERAGRAVKCPQCAKSVTVPNPNPEDAQESDS